MRMKFTLWKNGLALLLAAALLLSAGAALAETKITVSGTGEVLVSADTAVITIGVHVRDRDVMNAQRRANETVAAIREALIREGVPESDINTDYISLYAVYDYREDSEEEIAGYNASSTLAIRTTDLARVGHYIDICFGAGANTLEGVAFSASDTAAAQEEAMRTAVGNARRKAEVLASAEGLEIRKVESMSESNSFSYDSGANNFMARGTEEKEFAADGSPTVVQAAKLVVSVTVTVVYEAE